jgi:uracil-DNA glycosylase
LLGTAATGSLIPGPPASLRKLRGRWQQVAAAGLAEPIAALPTCSPDQLLASPGGKREAWADLLTLRLALDQDRKNRPELTTS